MSEKLQNVANNLSNREKIAAIIWLIIGIMQCLSVVFIFVGAWNIYASITRFKQAEAVKRPWPGLVNAYDNWMTRIIINIVINLIFGAGIGVIGGLYDLFAVRGYVMSNKDIFNEV